MPSQRLGIGCGGFDVLAGVRLNFGGSQLRLRFVPLETSFRSAYAYDNVLYNRAGLLLRQISGKSWAELIRQHFFTPLDMRDSQASIRDIDASTDAIVPHAFVDGKLRPLKHMPIDNNAPAGAIASSVNDMSRWVIALLNKGDLRNGKRLFTEQQARILWTPLTILPLWDPPAELGETKSHFAEYAMGEELTDYRGHLLVYHTGELQGMVSIVAMLPELNLGVVVSRVPNIDGVWELPHDSPKGEKSWRLIVQQKGAEIETTVLRVDGDTGGLTGSWQDGKFVASHFSSVT